MRSAVHIALWIDHREARIFRVEPERADSVTVNAPALGEHHKHPPGSGEPRKHPADQKHFFDAVGAALSGHEPILLLGPASAKFEFLRHLQVHYPEIEARIASVATVDHPTDGQLVAYARNYFKLKTVHFVKVSQVDAEPDTGDPYEHV